MGDLIATCMSPLSRNRTLGEQLGAGKTLDEILGATRTVAEGVGTAFTVHELAERYNMENARLPRGVPGPERRDPRLRGLPAACASRPATSASRDKWAGTVSAWGYG